MRRLGVLGLGASDYIKYGRISLIVKMTFEQKFQRRVALALQILTKHSRHRVQGEQQSQSRALLACLRNSKEARVSATE